MRKMEARVTNVSKHCMTQSVQQSAPHSLVIFDLGTHSAHNK